MDKASRAALGALLESALVVPRQVVVHDTRLGALLRFLQLGVLLYVALFQVAAQHAYAEFEPAAPAANIWGGSLPPSSTPSQHCGGALGDYDWPARSGPNALTPEESAISGGYAFRFQRCSPFDQQRHTVVTDTSFTVVTCEARDYSNGTRTAALVDEPERALFNLIHGFGASFLGTPVMNPATTLRGKDGRMIAHVPGGAILAGLPLTMWLEAAGISLDERNVQAWLQRDDPAASPFFRVTGAVLLARVTYSNLRANELPGFTAGTGEPRADITVQALPGAWGFLGAVQVAEDDGSGRVIPVALTRTGVKIQLSFAGSVGTPSIIQIVRRVVEAAVLLRVATTLTAAIARSCIFRPGAYGRLTSDDVPHETVREQRREGLLRCRCGAAAALGGDGAAATADAAAGDDGAPRTCDASGPGRPLTLRHTNSAAVAPAV